MISLKQFMEVVDYKITEGSEFIWQCFGSEAYTISAGHWKNDHSGWSANIIFNTQDQTVYIVETCDYKNNRAYRLINPNYSHTYEQYIKDNDYDDEAWEGVNFISLEVDTDWIEKTMAIKSGNDYSTKILVPLDLDKNEVFLLMKLAHERDITLNQLVENLLISHIKQTKESVVN